MMILAIKTEYHLIRIEKNLILRIKIKNKIYNFMIRCIIFVILLFLFFQKNHLINLAKNIKEDIKMVGLIT